MSKSKSNSSLGEEKRALARAAAGGLVRWRAGSWACLLSGDTTVTGLWCFSAQLYPKGRGSVGSDWELLGKMASAVGVPEGEREMGLTVDTSPNAVHKWMWVEDPSQPLGSP